MAEQLNVAQDWRDQIISDPQVILDDRDVMRALIAANEHQMGQNIVDLRGIAMERLEARLDRLEDTHRSVIAAAYENLAGMNQVHRCILRMLEASDLRDLLDHLAADLADILRLDRISLVLESAEVGPAPHSAVSVVSQGFVRGYVTLGRDVPVRQVTLRQCDRAADAVFPEGADWIKSEALLLLDLGPGRLPGLLVLGSEDPHQFRANQGIELLTFFTEAFERILRGHLG
ncbi:MAG: DUF484 family protein [Pseudomonadota bacterium]